MVKTKFKEKFNVCRVCRIDLYYQFGLRLKHLYRENGHRKVTTINISFKIIILKFNVRENKLKIKLLSAKQDYHTFF